MDGGFVITDDGVLLVLSIMGEGALVEYTRVLLVLFQVAMVVGVYFGGASNHI